MKRPDLTPSYYRKSALLSLAGSLWMVLLGLLSAFYLHFRMFWTLVFFGVAAFAFVGVLMRLWVARSIERSATRAARSGDPS